MQTKEISPWIFTLNISLTNFQLSWLNSLPAWKLGTWSLSVTWPLVDTMIFLLLALCSPGTFVLTCLNAFGPVNSVCAFFRLHLRVRINRWNHPGRCFGNIMYPSKYFGNLAEYYASSTRKLHICRDRSSSRSTRTCKGSCFLNWKNLVSLLLPSISSCLLYSSIGYNPTLSFTHPWPLCRCGCVKSIAAEPYQMIRAKS